MDRLVREVRSWGLWKAKCCEALHMPQALGDAEDGNVLPDFCPCYHGLSLAVHVSPLVFGILQPAG